MAKISLQELRNIIRSEIRRNLNENTQDTSTSPNAEVYKVVNLLVKKGIALPIEITKAELVDNTVYHQLRVLAKYNEAELKAQLSKEKELNVFTASDDPDEEFAEAKKVLGYYPGWKMGDENFKKLAQIFSIDLDD